MASTVDNIFTDPSEFCFLCCLSFAPQRHSTTDFHSWAVQNIVVIINIVLWRRQMRVKEHQLKFVLEVICQEFSKQKFLAFNCVFYF